ncbi:hypothetical protein F9K88_08185 [Brucella intermedia]|uniref:hypothetical protein n=1 Tax=Brucella intermedia TaxID=94625 RepID=UPI00124D070F|nr:hypothetical protein [Brucella intermedia]KAB2712923.1 hypothetical protein F9K88_08185 [Brucella intermedia]
MITNREKADCADREVKQRLRAYSRWVAEGRMTQAFADRQIEVMESIADDYRALADAEEAAGRLI